MSTNDKNPQLLITHAVLTGLTPLIPVPFVDDMVYSYLMRSMVQRLTDAHGISLNSNEVRALADQPGGNWIFGCLATVFLYLPKKLLRKVFFFLEWKRATDIISHTYYHGYLLEAAAEEGWLKTYGAARVRTAMDAVLARTNTSPLNRVVFGVVNQSKGGLKAASQVLKGAVDHLNGKPREADVAQAVDSVDGENRKLLDNIIRQLQQAVSTLPAEHFQDLRRQLGQELGVMKGQIQLKK